MGRWTAFTTAFRQGQGLSKGDRAFLTATTRYPAWGFVLALLVGFALAAIIVYRAPPAVYSVVIGGLFIGVVLGLVFVPALAGDFLTKRVERAMAVSDCVSAGKGTGEQCASKVRLHAEPFSLTENLK